MAGTRFELASAGVTSFLGIRECTKGRSEAIVMPHNKLWSFESFGTHDYLRELDVSNNRIETFLGLTKQKRLETLTVTGNPVAKLPHYRLMAILTIGFSLKSIDGTAVQPAELDQARKLGPSAALAVSVGWKLDLEPRDDQDFQHVINGLRTERRALLVRHERNNRAVTVLDAIDELSKRSASAAAPAAPADAATVSDAVAAPSEKPGKPAMDQAQDEAKAAKEVEASINKKALAHLSRRVAYLEARLAESEKEAQSLRTNASLRLLTGNFEREAAAPGTQALMPSEIAPLQMSLRIGETTSNVRVSGSTLQLAGGFLSLDHDSFSILTILNRQTVVARPWSAVWRLLQLRDVPGIRLELSDGVWVHMAVAPDALPAAWKTLHFFAGKPAPLLQQVRGGGAAATPDSPDVVTLGATTHPPLNTDAESQTDGLIAAAQAQLQPTPAPAAKPPAGPAATGASAAGDSAALWGSTADAVSWVPAAEAAKRTQSPQATKPTEPASKEQGNGAAKAPPSATSATKARTPGQTSPAKKPAASATSKAQQPSPTKASPTANTSKADEPSTTSSTTNQSTSDRAQPPPPSSTAQPSSAPAAAPADAATTDDVDLTPTTTDTSAPSSARKKQLAKLAAARANVDSDSDSDESDATEATSDKPKPVARPAAGVPSAGTSDPARPASSAAASRKPLVTDSTTTSATSSARGAGSGAAASSAPAPATAPAVAPEAAATTTTAAKPAEPAKPTMTSSPTTSSPATAAGGAAGGTRPAVRRGFKPSYALDSSSSDESPPRATRRAIRKKDSDSDE